MFVRIDGRGSARACALLASAAILLLANPVRSGEPGVADELGATIRIHEEQIARGERCSARVEWLEKRIATLNSRTPPPDENVIADLEQKLESSHRCVSSSERRAALAAREIVTARQEYLDLTGVGAAELDAQIEQLREDEGKRVRLEFRVGSLERQIARLPLDPVGNATLITQRTSVLNGARDDLAAAQDRIVAVSGQLQSVELAVIQSSAGTALLSWSTPTTRENGTPLAPGEIGGFEIYVLSESTGESVVIVIEDPLAVTHTVDGLAPDTYYFSISAFDSAGHYSQLSEVVSKTII